MISDDRDLPVFLPSLRKDGFGLMLLGRLREHGFSQGAPRAIYALAASLLRRGHADAGPVLGRMEWVRQRREGLN